MFSYLCFIALCGLSVANLMEWQSSFENRIRQLGPLGNALLGRATIDCPALHPSSSIPTSVHKLRPADIKHVAAIGDSLTAANGAGASTLFGLLIEYRGLCFSMGGDQDLSTRTTLPNIMRVFNKDLSGMSTGTGNQNSSGAGFNVAKPGAVSRDMPGQAAMLVKRMKEALGANFASDWKLVTFFIGGNDLCAVCKNEASYSTANFVQNVQTTLDYLKANMPRTFVNFITVLNVAALEDLHEGVVCQSMQNLLCECGVNKVYRELVRQYSLAYQAATNKLIASGRYDTSDDFTAVRQPFMEHMTVPLTDAGTPDFSAFAPDCFHFSRKGHEATAVELWNNMMQKVGSKNTLWDPLDVLSCPSEGDGFIYTAKNSH